jgi:purine-nucleoside phosphorylase
MSNNSLAPKFVKQLRESHDYILTRLNFEPKIAIILGSGLGDFADALLNKTVISAADIPHYPVSTVSGHQGKLVFGFQGNIPIMAVQGRTHFYEGLSFFKITWVVRLMSRLGLEILIVTNAAGGINPTYQPGDLMVINDHINLMFGNPLVGSPDSYMGVYGKGETSENMYDEEFCQLINRAGKTLKIQLKNGILLATSGPSYETAAEIRMARQIGADAVSMSTIPEVLLANNLGIRTVGISLITNMATGLSSTILSHSEVTSMAKRSKLKFQELISRTIEQIDGVTVY